MPHPKAHLPTDLAAVWRRYDADEQRLSAPLSERMLDSAGVGTGMRVLDLATGRGEPAIRAAHRVGVSGRVVGVDVDAEMLTMARARADHEGLTNLDLHAGRAENLAVDGDFDVVLARWGLMYMADPVAALRAVRRVTRPGGVFVGAVWVEPARVPYYSLPRRVLARHVRVADPDMNTPGTFYYADPGRLERHLGEAGWRVETVDEVEVPVMEARSDAELLAWVRAFGLERLLSTVPAAVSATWEAEFLTECRPLWSEGRARLGGVTRIVVARKA